jgi:hypothetical protein
MFGAQRIRFTLLSSLAAMLLLLTSAGGVGASASQTAPASCAPAIAFASENFPASPKVDNTWFPLDPGTQFTLEGRANRGGGLLPHKVIFTVTDLTKVIDGVRTVVVWDQDINEGQLVEAELAFFAQDNAGNVWNLGEYPEEYEDGVFVGAPSTWIAGLAGAEGGIHMLAKPRTGTSWYLQGSAPEIDFLDCAKVLKTGETTCVPFNSNCYKNVLVTDETSPLDQGGGHQLKYHAPGVGIVQVGAVADREGETLVLTGLVHLGPGALAQARQQALKLDRRGYQVSDVYGQTPPAE